MEGRNVIIERRYAATQSHRLAQMAVALVQLKVDVIYGTGPAALEAAMNATATIPIVTVCCNDAVREGWAQSVARPGRNVTGFTVTYPEMGAKRLQILKEGVPGLSRLAVLVDPAEIPNSKEILKVLRRHPLSYDSRAVSLPTLRVILATAARWIKVSVAAPASPTCSHSPRISGHRASLAPSNT